MSSSGRTPKGGSRASSPDGRKRSGSTGTANKPANPYGGATPLGYDPAKPKDPNHAAYLADKKDADNKNIDLPPEAYAKTPLDVTFMRRPGFNNTGKMVKIDVNQFRVKSIDASKKIYQYDIALSPIPKGVAAVFKKCWNHPRVKAALAETKVEWLYDGRKLAWAPVLVPRGEIRMSVDLDEGKTNVKPERVDKNKFLVTIRNTTQIDLSSLPRYLNGEQGWHDGLLECMNFLDHVVRQGPSTRFTSIKRNFFSRQARSNDLEKFIHVIKGIYTSIRMNQSIKEGGMGLGLNVDVANTAFWRPGSLSALVVDYLGWCDRRKWGMLEERDLARTLAPVETKGGWAFSDAFKCLRKLHKLHFTVKHRGKEADPKVYAIHHFMFDEKFGAKGATSATVTFEKDGKTTTVQEYFKDTYKHLLSFPGAPLVATTRAGFFPMEVCTVVPMERYQYKLDGEQTSKMIKFAVTRPEQRKKDIAANRDQLSWADDPYLRQYGIQIDPNFARVEARLLPNPEIRFANGKINPGVSGRWDLRGKKFLTANAFPLKSWAFVAMENSITMKQLDEFAQTFHKTYTGHGGQIVDKPMIIDQLQTANAADAILNAYRAVMAKWGSCQILFCVLRAKNTGGYERLKKSADCRFGILTQALQSVHVERNNGQYHSNVCMKVNAKLGGVTCKVPAPTGDGPAFFARPTMMIGADVSHAAPGSPVASMAAMTMSVNRDATRFAAACNTNGHRIEMLKQENIFGCMYRLLPTWRKNIGPENPHHVYYFRDGVAESQFVQVLEDEVKNLKLFFQEHGNKRVPKFTVIIATKRHHIRFFPEHGDKNKNPLPGTLVEKEVTHPFQWDFYLCSHVAIQGTARPVHYSVIMDEANCNPADLQRMLYQQCYQYIRSTTPVSLHPAVYYAHLASNRARYHENIATSEGFRSGGLAVAQLNEKIGKQIVSPQSMDAEAMRIESSPLLPLGGSPTSPESKEVHRNWINQTMWYI